MKPEEGFCRIALSGADVLIYEFRHGDPEPCLAKLDRYGFNDFVARFGISYAQAVRRAGWPPQDCSGDSWSPAMPPSMARTSLKAPSMSAEKSFGDVVAETAIEIAEAEQGGAVAAVEEAVGEGLAGLQRHAEIGRVQRGEAGRQRDRRVGIGVGGKLRQQGVGGGSHEGFSCGPARAKRPRGGRGKGDGPDGQGALRR